jgi:TolB-like protein/Tfp pilus assembly protein PilF
MPSFLDELRRRNVFKVGLAYLAMAWLLLQVGDTVFPAFGAPAWSIRALIVFLVAGLPFTVMIAWVFELTPEGLKRTDDIPADTSFTRQTGRKLDFVIITFLSLALIAVVIDRYVVERETLPSVSTLAVLPLDNLSGNPEQDYFVDGMTEAIITNLSKVSALRVMSRTSVMRFKNSERSLPAIAAELGADAVITGSVSRQGDQVRITAQMVDVATDTMLWGESFDREFSDILAVQSEIAKSITEQIQVSVTPDELARLARAGVASADGYDDYLKGMERFYRLTPQDLEVAIEYFDRSLEQNPNSALALSGVAAAWIGLQQMGFVPPDQASPKSEAAALRALEIDDELAEPHLWLAVIRSWRDYNWSAAEELFTKAIRLNPSYADVRGSYGHFLAVLGRFDESLAQIEVALELDPFNGWIIGLNGVVYHMSHRYDEAIVEFERALRISPDLPFVWLVLAGSYHYSGQFDKAIQADASYLNALGMTEAQAELMRRYEADGYQAAAAWLADLMAEQSVATGTLANWTAMRYARAGNNEKVIEWLERSLEQSDPNAPYLRVPEFDALHSDPRVRELIRRLGI